MDGEEVQNEKIAVIEATPNKTITGPHGYGRTWIKGGTAAS
jgi:hypothetical protein